MIRLKNYNGLLNLDKFTRMEPDVEETYLIPKRKNENGGLNSIKYDYVIKCYTAEGYGGMLTTIRYGENKQARDEDWLLIMQICCENLNQNFELVKEVETIQSTINSLKDQANELIDVTQSLRKQAGKIKK